jgi:hypothetical protein
MTHADRHPAVYQLRVAGLLDQHWSLWFGGFTVTHQDDGHTSLTGTVIDQAQLHGLLAKIRDLGLTLISVTVLDPARETP